MSFSSINNGNLKLGNITTYNSKNTTSSVFKNKFYSDIEEIDYGKYEEINYDNSVDLEKGIETKLNEKEWYEVAAATGCVALTTVVSGVLKIAEAADDGLTWLSGMAVSGVARLFGQDEFAEKYEEVIMDEIARDKVGEMNSAFYENTEVGRAINEASAMKYDSELAQGIQNITTEVAIIAGATAATVVTGGAAAPLFAAGFAIGAGQSAEKKFQDKENRDFWKDSVEIGVDGTIKGFSTMAYGKAGAVAFNGVKTLSSLGLTGTKEMIKTGVKNITKDSLKTAIKTNGKTIFKNTAVQTLKDKDTWLETGAVLADDIKTGIQTGEWNGLAMLGDAALIYGENYIGNLAGSFVGDVLDNSKKSFAFETDQSVNKIGNGPGSINIDSNLGNLKKYSDSTESIKQKFCSTYELDYENDSNTRKIVNSVMNLIEKNEFTDKNVKYLFENLDKLKKVNPSLSIGYWDSGSKFWGGGNVLAMDVNDLDICDMVLSHELGHVIYDTVEGNPKKYWQPELTKKNKGSLELARKHILENKPAVIEILSDCGDKNNKAFSDTVDWYNNIRDSENMRISNIIDDLYKNQDTESLKNIVEKGSKMSQVKSILSEAGLSDKDVNDLIIDKDIVKKIAITQNNINNQMSHYSKLNGKYDEYGDYRKMSSIIDSITQSDETYTFTFGHNKDYWQQNGDCRSYNELLADYVSLSANGRIDALNKLESVCGPEIFNDIRDTLSTIVSKLGG